MAARDFADPLGAVDTMLKDIDTVMEVATANEARLPMTRTAWEIMTATAQDGHAQEDISTLILTYDKDDGA